MADPHERANPEFPPTRWTLILDLRSEDRQSASAALNALCELYWYPVYAYFRREGRTPEDAQDLTQGYFSQLIEREDLQSVSRQRGKLRSYLLKSAKHFLIDDWRRRTAEKRGGGQEPLPIEFITAEDRYQLEPSESSSPEALFDRRWAFDMVSEAIGRLERDYQDGGKGALHEAIQPYLTTPTSANVCEEIGKALGMSSNAVEVALYRYRKRFRKRLQGLIGETVASPEEVDDELRYIVTLFAAG